MHPRSFTILLVAFGAFLPPAVAEETAEAPHPALEEIGFVTLLNDYLRREFAYESDLVYESLNLEVNQAWTFLPAGERGGLGYLNVAERLRGAMTRNPSLQVLFACGYYDLATPYFDCKHTVAHLDLPRELRGNVRVATYEAGHMMYLRETDHAKLKRDVATLVERAASGDGVSRR